ncbi:MAG: hypothetical protein JJE30_13495 [Desulfuromonadales bacterium]|nr:hypothetical protein [Desulfuromonadales bacterium]
MGQNRKPILMFLRIGEHLGVELPAGTRILDFGCGIGHGVEQLVSLGFDAYGIDVLELWGKDRETYWKEAPLPKADIIQRLHWNILLMV